jgi:hypothetical protein
MTYFPAQSYGGFWVDSDGDGIPDVADPYPNDSNNNSVWWNGGTFLVDGVWVTMEGCYHAASAGDSDYDGIPDDLDPYPSDPANNSAWWYGGDFLVNGTMVHLSGQYHRADAADSDGDSIPDDIDPQVGTNNDGYYWPGGNFLIDSQWTNLGGGSYPGSWSDIDGDGIPDPADPYPNDPYNNTYFTWGGLTYIIDDVPHYFSVATYAGLFVDTDNDGIPDVADPYPNDPTNHSDLDGDGVPDYIEIAYGFNSSTVDTLRNIGGAQDGLTWRQAYQNGLLDTLLDPNLDSDSDGMTDFYEITHGLDRFNPLDALGTPAGDYVFNVEKATQGLDLNTPVDPSNYTAVTGRDLATVLAHNDPNKSNAENDWDGDGVANADEVLVFHMDARDPGSVPDSLALRDAILNGQVRTTTTLLNFSWLAMQSGGNSGNTGGTASDHDGDGQSDADEAAAHTNPNYKDNPAVKLTAAAYVFPGS